MMAKREHRMHHWLWHEVRNSWYSYSDDIKKELERLGWKPPRPSMDEQGQPDLKNDSGEDFLYMHRQMIADVNAILADVGDSNYPRVEGWTVSPPPGDPDFPVPPPWFDPLGQGLPFDRLQRVKSDIAYQKRFLYWQKTFRDPAFLRSVSLGELGVLIELTIHNAMHMRWASTPTANRPDPDPAQSGTISTKWDDSRYDFLGDTYSSHVHPIFWKLHGWVDDRVEDWKVANLVFGNNFWKGTWVGKMPGHEDDTAAAPGVHAQLENSEHAHPHTSEVEEAVRCIAQAGVLHKGFVNAISYEAW